MSQLPEKWQKRGEGTGTDKEGTLQCGQGERRLVDTMKVDWLGAHGISDGW